MLTCRYQKKKKME